MIKIGFALTLFLASACATVMAPDQLLKQMKEGGPPLIVDVRSRGEYDKDHIAGAVHIPFYLIRSGLRGVRFSKKDRLVLYCEHGPRAGIASLTLFLSVTITSICLRDR